MPEACFCGIVSKWLERLATSPLLGAVMHSAIREEVSQGAQKERSEPPVLWIHVCEVVTFEQHREERLNDVACILYGNAAGTRIGVQRVPVGVA